MRDVIGLPLGLLLIACGGSTINGGDGGGSSGPCSIAAGTYTQQFSAEDGGASCPSIPDQTVTINANETLTGASSAPADGGNGCTVNEDPSTCTLTENCTTTSSGLTTQIDVTFTFSGDSASGKETIEDTDSTGNILDCTYDITMTK